MAQTYAEYVEEFNSADAVMFRSWFAGSDDQLLTESEWQAVESGRAEDALRSEGARIARLAAAGHGPADIVTVGGLSCVLRDVRRAYNDQPSCFWEMMAEAHGRFANEDDWMWRSYGLIDQSEPA